MKRCLRVLWLTFCEADERYIDLFRVGYALVLVSGVALTAWAVFNGQDFDVTAFGTGMGAILFGGGVGVGLRGRLEDGKPADEEEGWGRNSPWRTPPPRDDGSHWFEDKL